MAISQRGTPGAVSARDEAVARVRRLKSWSLFGSVAAFGTFIALAASNVVGVTSRLHKSSAPSSSVPSFNSPSASQSFFQGGGDGAQFAGGPPSGGGLSSAPAGSTTVS